MAERQSSGALPAAAEGDEMASTFRWAQGKEVGNYIIERLVAHGGMGEVYRARHKLLSRVVALKTVREKHADNLELLGRFVREAQVLERIDHPHVVRVWDAGEHEGTLYMAMEWLPGETLAARLIAAGPMQERELVGVLLQMCAGVAAAHAQGVVHRDLKPDNIFLVPVAGGEVAKVVDFGIASAGVGGNDGVVTATRSLYGTPYYMSPEQWDGVKNVTAASDQFSLGVIAYECATGVRPFEVEDPSNHFAIGAKTKAGAYAPLRALAPSLSVEFEAVVGRMLQTSPERRYGSVSDLGLALLALADEAAQKVYGAWFTGAASTLQPGGAATLVDPSCETPAPVPGPHLNTLGASVRVVDTDAPTVRRARRGVWAGAAVGVVTVALLVVIGVQFARGGDDTGGRHAATPPRDTEASSSAPVTPVEVPREPVPHAAPAAPAIRAVLTTPASPQGTTATDRAAARSTGRRSPRSNGRGEHEVAPRREPRTPPAGSAVVAAPAPVIVAPAPAATPGRAQNSLTRSY